MNVKNRKCIIKLSIRSLWAARKRNVIAIIAIALTALLFTSIFTIVMSINSSYETYTFRQIGGYCHGTFKAVTQEQAQEIAAHRKVKAVGARTIIGVSDSDVFAKEPAEISYMDDNCSEWSYALPSVGHTPQSENEITMDTKALELLGVMPEIGEEIPLTYTVCDQNQTIVTKTDVFTLVGWWEYDELSPVHYINISKEYADSIAADCTAFGAEPFRTDLNVMLPSELDIRGQMERIENDLGYTWEENQDNTVHIGVNWGYTASSLGESMDFGTAAVIAMLLVLVILAGYLIIYTIFKISVSGDIRCYGLLKTIGTTPRQLRRIIRLQALCLCVVGIPLGLLIGYGIGAALTPVVLARMSLGANHSTISASPVIFIASVLFALVTVLLSCSRPGRIASKVSPVEAAKYTEASDIKKERRATRGAKVHQMAFANLGRSRSRTVLIIVSLALSVVLLNVLTSFTGGFDMEKYLSAMTSADFIIGSTDYFRADQYCETLSPEQIDEIRANTSASLSGCGYTLSGAAVGWMPEELWLADMEQYGTREEAELNMAIEARRGDMVSQTALIEGLDGALFDKLTVVEGDIEPLFAENSNAVAIVVDVDEYGNIYNLESCPAIGSEVPVTYMDSVYYIDTRTGEAWTDETPYECMERQIPEGSREADYYVCAYVEVPQIMSYRYLTMGYRLLLPAERLIADSDGAAAPMFYIFDAADAEAETAAEQYLADYTGNVEKELMYESKSTIREDFEDFQKMFLLLGGILCAIIGLIGILYFFNAIMTGIISRKREFAVLQSVGMTNRQLRSMLIYEGMFYALCSAAAALILSVIFCPLTGRLFEEMFWFYSARFTIVPVLIVIPVFAMLGWLIPSLIFGQSMKESVIERLRED